ncbi:hypothetical protein THAOC_31502, partial [Thalassiosira oceanica]
LMIMEHCKNLYFESERKCNITREAHDRPSTQRDPRGPQRLIHSM